LKTAKILLNRITISIMNLWAKRIGQLSTLAVALFFLSCQDEASLLGYKNPNTKFEVSYVEIPLESSVLLLDSQRTSNFTFTNETSRFLLGEYVDAQVGSVSASAFTQYFTTTGAPIPLTSVYDSVSLRLWLDYTYYYDSSQTASTYTLNVYEAEEELSKGIRNYFNTSEVISSATSLGSKNIYVDPLKIKEGAKILSDNNTANDTLLIPIIVRLDRSFGQEIFDYAMAYAAKTDTVTFVNDHVFTKIFKGIGLKATGGTKIFGINPTASSVVLHYHNTASTTPDKEIQLSLGFTSGFRVESGQVVQTTLTGFSQIKGNRVGTPLEPLTQYSQDFFPSNDLRYIQGGTGVYTKIDFGKFFEFADTVPNVVINSAQLVIESVVVAENFPISTTLGLRILDTNNRIEKYKLSESNYQDSIDFYNHYNPSQYSSYPGSLGVDAGNYYGDADNAFVALADDGTHLAYTSTNKSFLGNYSLFFQQLARTAETKTRFKSAVLYPIIPGRPGSTKTVNRTIFPSSGIKLKIYYTKPTTPLN
jgi:hypothetical protein